MTGSCVRRGTGGVRETREGCERLREGEGALRAARVWVRRGTEPRGGGSLRAGAGPRGRERTPERASARTQGSRACSSGGDLRGLHVTMWPGVVGDWSAGPEGCLLLGNR